MDITRENFEENFAFISEAIHEATFLTFDTEFTGLDDGSHDYITSFDTPEERYHKLIKPASDYLVVQFGLCAWKKISNGSYEARSFNFYVFPRSSKLVPDVTFSCQNSSLEFIVSQGIDFGKVITQGVSYLSVENEKKLHDALLTKHVKQDQESHPDNQNHNNSPPTNVPLNQQAFVDRQIKHVQATLSTKEIASITLEPCSSFTRKLLYEQLTLKFSDQLFLETISENKSWPVLKVTFVENCEHRKELEMKKHSSELEELQKILGFTRIIKLLHQSKKLLIGHNMLLDLMHTVSQFWSTLPESYGSFKELSHFIFPRVLDTKHMASAVPFKDITANMNLQNLYGDLKKNKKIPEFGVVIPAGFSDYKQQECYHNAAFDAYVTGLCFLHMTSYLSTIEKQVSVEEKVKHFENKLFLMKIFDVPYINLGGNDLPLSRDHMFHIQFLKNKKRVDLQNLFSPYGNIYVKFIDDTSAFVCMSNRENSGAVKKNLLSSEKNHWFRLQSYSEWLHSKTVKTLPAGKPATREGHQSLKRKHPGAATTAEKFASKKSNSKKKLKPIVKKPETGIGEGKEAIEEEIKQHSVSFEIPDWD